MRSLTRVFGFGSAGKKNSKRSGKKPLRFESLERRTLLSASMPTPVQPSSGGGGIAVPAQLTIVSWQQLPVKSLQLHGGDSDRSIDAGRIMANRNAVLTGLDWWSGEWADAAIAGNIDNVTVYVDRDGNPLNGMQWQYFGSGKPDSGIDTLPVYAQRPFQLRAGKTYTIDVHANMDWFLEGQSLSVEPAGLLASDVWGMPVGEKISPRPTWHEIVQPTVSAWMNWDGAPTFPLNQSDAVLGGVGMDVMDGPVLVQTLYVAIEAQTPDGQATADIASFVSNVEMRNTKTGQVMVATPDFGGVHDWGDGNTSSFQIYSLRNFTLSGYSSWDMRCDLSGRGVVQSGTQIRGWVNQRTPQEDSSKGLFPWGYDLQATSLNGRYPAYVPEGSSVGTFCTMQDPAELALTIDGPAGQVYAPDQYDAVLANVVYTATEPEVITQYVLIEGQNAEGQALTNSIADVMEDVSLRDADGRTVYGVRLTDIGDFGSVPVGDGRVSTYQVYRFDDIVADTTSLEWQLNVDFNGQDAIPSGATFRARVNVAATAQSTCGILPATPKYDMRVTQLDSGGSVSVMPDGGALAGNVMTVVHPYLSIVEKLGPSVDTVVSNQKDVTVVRMDVHANEVRDLLLTRVIVGAAEGSMANGYNYALWVDTDGDNAVDTILEDGVASQFNQVDFVNLVGGGYVVGKDGTIRMEVHMDVAASFLTPTLRTELLGVEAERVDTGASVGWDISHGNQTVFSFAKQGDLYVTQSAMVLPERELLGGTLSGPVLALRFHAESEDIDVTDLQISAMAGQGQSVDAYELWVNGSRIARSHNSGSDDTPPGVMTQVFTLDAKQLVVPKGSDVTADVRARSKTDTNGGVSGESLQLWMSGRPVSNDATGEGAVRARGVASSNNLVANNGDTDVQEGEVLIGTAVAGPNHDIVGTANTVVMSKLTSVVNAGPASGSVPVGVDAEIGQFQFFAAANVNTKNGLNKAVLDTLTFTVNTTNVEIDRGFNLVNRLNPALFVPASTVEVLPSGLGYCVTFTGLAENLSVDTAIDSGASGTFALRANITNPNTAASSGGSSHLQTALELRDEFFTRLDKDTSLSTHIDGVDLPDTLILGTVFHG